MHHLYIQKLNESPIETFIVYNFSHAIKQISSANSTIIYAKNRKPFKTNHQA